jgi:hypothetical protein
MFTIKACVEAGVLNPKLRSMVPWTAESASASSSLISTALSISLLARLVELQELEEVGSKLSRFAVHIDSECKGPSQCQ